MEGRGSLCAGRTGAQISIFSARNMWGPGRGAGVMNFKESDVSLFLWQRAAFHGSRSDDSGTRGDKTTVDSLRMRLGQLEHACWKE